MTFGENLKQYLDDKGLNTAEAARLCKLHDSTIRSILTRNSESVDVRIGIKLSRGLKLSTDTINSWCGVEKVPANNQEAYSMLETEMMGLLQDISYLPPEEQPSALENAREYAKGVRERVGRKRQCHP